MSENSEIAVLKANYRETNRSIKKAEAKHDFNSCRVRSYH